MIVARFALVLALAPHAQVADTGHRAPLPGMPPGRDSANIHAAIGAGMLDSGARRALPPVHVDCPGVDHLEFTAEGRYALATCEFSGKLVKLDVETHQVVGYLVLDSAGLGAHGAPQDIRSAPDGSVFFVADMHADGVYVVDPYAFRTVGFIPTGPGTHGIYPSRDGRYLSVTNRAPHA